MQQVKKRQMSGGLGFMGKQPEKQSSLNRSKSGSGNAANPESDPKKDQDMEENGD